MNTDNRIGLFVGTTPALDSLQHKNKAAFEEYHAANPQVYRRLRAKAFALLATGKRKYGINTLIEVLRWEHDMSIDTTDEFKINNNHAPFYARLLMETNPELEGFFNLRDQKG
jgi:hypothetical protein